VRQTRFVDDYLGYLLGQASHSVYREFDQRVRAAGLSSLEWRVLAVLRDSAPLPVSRLAEEVLAKQPTLTKLVQRMARQGWVRLLADPLDQRRTLVQASAAGQRLVEPLIEQARRHEAQSLRPLSTAQARTLKKLLARLVLAP
jgi:DNA-binding MarR family transcriptional regulator